MLRARVRSASRWSLMVTLAAAAASAPLAAQEASTRGDWTSKWSASLGVDPFETDGSLNFSENFAAAIARQWSRPGSRLGFRAQLGVGRLPSTTQSFNVTQCSDCALTRTERYQELSGAAVITFMRNSRFKPYLLAGPGIYRVSSSYLARGLVLGTGENPSTSSFWALGLTAGAGASLRLFGKELFIEQRILFPEASTGFRAGPTPHPLSIGVKFEKE